MDNNPKPSVLAHAKHHNWSRDGFLISTDPSFISVPALTLAFSQPWLYWAKPLPIEAMQAMVANSLCFGLYTPTPQTPAAAMTSDPLAKVKDSEARPAVSRTDSADTGTSMIGFARVMTDHVTVAYLTDVYVLPEWQGEGLGKWLIECVREVVEGWPHLRRSFLVTGREGKSVRFYERVMGMEVVEGKDLVAMTWQGPGWGGS